MNYLRIHPRHVAIVNTSSLVIWPQHFDGKGWENQFAVKYGIFGVPTMWLLDRRGNLRDVEARGDLERRVKALLSEPNPSKP